MTYDEKIRWLRRYRDSLRHQLVLEQEVEALRSEAVRVTPLLSGMPGAGGDGGKLPRDVERIDEARGKLQQQIRDCLTVYAEIVDAINHVSNPLDRDILRRRYILGQKWERIAVDIPMDYSNVHRHHRKAIENIAIVCHTETC